MAIAWREELSIGVEEIDDQHKELIERFSMLLTACKEGKGSDEVRRLVAFLNEYVISHFSDEEELQRKSGFPDYEAHRREHAGFCQQLADLKQRIDSEGEILVDHVLEANQMLLNWLIKHISVRDKAIGRHINKMK